MLTQQILVVLRESEEPLTVREIAEKVNATPNGVRRALKRLPALMTVMRRQGVKGYFKTGKVLVEGHFRDGSYVKSHYREVNGFVPAHTREVQAFMIES